MIKKYTNYPAIMKANNYFKIQNIEKFKNCINKNYAFNTAKQINLVSANS